MGDVNGGREAGARSARFVSRQSRLPFTIAVTLRRQRVPRLSAICRFEELGFISPILRDGPAIFMIHKIQLDDVFTVGQKGLETVRDWVPRLAAIIGAIQNAFDWRLRI